MTKTKTKTALITLLWLILVIGLTTAQRVAPRRLITKRPPTTNLICWLEAGLEVGLSNDDPVTTATDQSGSSNSPTQGTSNKRPLYKTSIVNGQPVYRYDGSNDVLSFGDDADFDFGTGNYSVFVVVRGGAGILAPILLKMSFTDASTEGLRVYAFNSPSEARVTYDTSGGYIALGTLDTSAHLLGVVRAGTGTNQTSYYYDNASAQTATDARNYSNTYALRIAGDDSETFFAAIDIAALFIHNAAISGGDLTQLKEYINERYAIY